MTEPRFPQLERLQRYDTEQFEWDHQRKNRGRFKWNTNREKGEIVPVDEALRGDTYADL